MKVLQYLAHWWYKILFQRNFEVLLQYPHFSDSFITFYHQCDQLDNNFICIMVRILLQYGVGIVFLLGFGRAM
jgi:hypothetical protein